MRVTDRDVILARADLPQSKLKVLGVQQGNFSEYPKVPIGNTGEFIHLVRLHLRVLLQTHP